MIRLIRSPQIAPSLLGLMVLLLTAVCSGQVTSQEEAKASQEEAKASQELEVRRELNRLLQDQAGVPAAITYLDSVLDKFPTDSDMHLLAVNLNASRGMQLLSEDQIEAGHAAIRRAEVLAKAVVADPKHLQAAETMLAEVFFYAAQTYATDSNPTAMYAALDQACDLGFERWDAFEEAAPFADWVANAEFQAYLAKQKALVPERIAIGLRKELLEFQSFDFDFSLTSVTGEPVAKSQWKGKLLVVDVWGTWCPPCRQALPHLIKLQEKYRQDGVQIIGLNIENEESTDAQAKIVNAAIQEFKINYPCALIDNDFLATIPDFEGFPTALLIDGTGRVRLKLVGSQSPTRLETAVKILLEETKSDRP